MPNVTVTNTHSAPISFLGLGPVAPNKTKSGYIEEAMFAPHAHAYRTRAANVGLVVQELGMALPTGVESITGAATLADATKVALLKAESADYAVQLPYAGDVAEGSKLNLRFEAGSYSVAITPQTGSGDKVGTADVTYDLAATSADASPGFAITTTHTITRADGGSWITEGYLPGGRIVIQGAEDSGNNGTHVIGTVAESVLTVTSTLTNNAADTTVHFGVDNRIRANTANDIVRLVSNGVDTWSPA